MPTEDERRYGPVSLLDELSDVEAIKEQRGLLVGLLSSRICRKCLVCTCDGTAHEEHTPDRTLPKN